MNFVHDLQRHQSNTYSLLAGNGNEHAKDGGEGTQWSGVLIEANPQKFRELKKLYDPLVGNICVCAEVSYKPTSSRSLMSILKRDAPHLPPDFDFLSIDIDGMDYWVLADTLGVSIPMSEIMEGEMSNSYRPKVICIEFNPTMPIDLVFVTDHLFLPWWSLPTLRTIHS